MTKVVYPDKCTKCKAYRKPEDFGLKEDGTPHKTCFKCRERRKELASKSNFNEMFEIMARNKWKGGKLWKVSDGLQGGTGIGEHLLP